MKAMMLTGIRKMEMTDVPDPVIKNPDDVLIRMLVVGYLRFRCSLFYTGTYRFSEGYIPVYTWT